MVSIWFIVLYSSLVWLTMLIEMFGMFLACQTAAIVRSIKEESNLCKQHAWRLRDQSTESRVNILLFLSSKVLSWDSRG